jgi:hypothetical protein
VRLLALAPAVYRDHLALGLLVDREEVLDLVAQLLGQVVELLVDVPVGIVARNQRIFSSSPLSSLIENSAMGFTTITQPGNVASETVTIASKGSPSAASVLGMNP